MDFRLLGPLEVVADDGTVGIEAHKPRELLALLLLHANEIVPAERLIEALWDESPPASATKLLQTYVSQLRKQLGRERIITKGPGCTAQNVHDLHLQMIDLVKTKFGLVLNREVRFVGKFDSAQGANEQGFW